MTSSWERPILYHHQVNRGYTALAGSGLFSYKYVGSIKIFTKNMSWLAIPGAVRYEQTTDIEESGCLIKHLRALSTR